MIFEVKTFKELSTSELFEIYRLRARVFVVEQNCAYQDVDEKDLKAHHVLSFENGELIAYARLLPPAVSYQEPAIGRVVVAPEYRRTGTGQKLMKYCLQKMTELFKNKDVVISAQTYLSKFYNDLGFISEGEGCNEDGIPHQKMRYKIK